ncbi:hypothetical protein GLI01_18070 [Gluconacetobacter liquefaciens]|uniref:Uncharacterized protein n=2 Tax=Gluconacetobacter liquefaciens TaxID=89584 RepID=A0A370GE99_GLULI|nr:hypothetical protein [Gluconacetobacter liquefaciens]RDI40774.1 hypothetical protein C7453_101573 [Gluconacetobacter liquefaciens]GBR01711.1 hypothetical protein AA0522_1565 [Gluconacetobacter liquefaciens NRIC 0522]GEB37772.1 hypothetical protein GLI01_18070 [Gluconacetobacter liquefaciens]
MSDLMSRLKSKRRYLIELGVCLALYVLAIRLSMLLLNDGIATGIGKPIAALIPMVPGSGMCWVIVRQFHRMDELQRRIQFEALGFAFAGTAIVTFSYGFLETVGFAKVSMFFVWGVMAVLWSLGMAVATRRYR